MKTAEAYLIQKNDTFEMIIENRRSSTRAISSSIVINTNNSEDYRYLLNFEYGNNLELIDIKTGKIIIENLFSFLSLFGYKFLYLTWKATTILLELNEKNIFLLASFIKKRINDKIVLFYAIFSLEDSKQKIGIYSLNKIEENILNFKNISFNIYERFYFIQTKKRNLYLSFVSDKKELYYYDVKEEKEYLVYNLSYKTSLQKLLLIKEEIKFLSYYSMDKYIVFLIFETINTSRDNIILEFTLKKYLPYLDDNDYIDAIFLSEIKAIFILEQTNSITIFIIFF